jgi:hypothetical protein
MKNHLNGKTTWALLVGSLIIVAGIYRMTMLSDRYGTERPRGKPGASFKRLTVDELDARMQEARAGKIKLFIYDNNPLERFQKSHIPGAKWVKYDEIKASDLPPDKEAMLVFYCANES